MYEIGEGSHNLKRLTSFVIKVLSGKLRPTSSSLASESSLEVSKINNVGVETIHTKK